MTASDNNQLHPDDAYGLEVSKSRSESRERSKSPSIKERIKDFFKKSDNEASDGEEERPKKRITKKILKAAEKGVVKAVESNLHHHCTDYQLSDTSVAGSKAGDSSEVNNGSGILN